MSGDLVEKFTGAAYLGDEKTLKQLLELHRDNKDFVNSVNQRGQTALYCAARGSEPGHYACLVALLNIPSVEVDTAIGAHGGTALHAATFSYNARSAAALLYRGANPDAKNNAGLKPTDEINHGGEKAAIILEVFNIFKTRKLPGLLEAFPELSNISLRLSLATGSSGLSTKPSSLALIEKEETVKQISTREETEMREILKFDPYVQNQMIYKIRKEVRHDIAPLRRELLNPPSIHQVVPQIFPGGEIKKKWRYVNDFGILSSCATHTDLEVVIYDNVFYLCMLLNFVTPEDVLDFIILGNQFVSENNSMNPMIDYNMIRGAIIAYGILPKASVMATTARIDVYIKTP